VSWRTHRAASWFRCSLFLSYSVSPSARTASKVRPWGRGGDAKRRVETLQSSGGHPLSGDSSPVIGQVKSLQLGFVAVADDDADALPLSYRPMLWRRLLPPAVAVAVVGVRPGVVPLFPPARPRGVPPAAAAVRGRRPGGTRRLERSRLAVWNGRCLGSGSGGGPLGLLRTGTSPTGKVGL